MKKMLGKIMIIFITVFYIMNAVFPNVIFANNSQGMFDPLADLGLGVLDGLLGIVMYPIKILLLIPGVLINLTLGGIASLGGKWEYGVTLADIIFDRITITKIDIFNINDVENTPIATIRESIAGFYVALRNLAIVLSLAVLIYIGIKMALSNIAEEKAKYKQMLTNWVVGFGLIFILHYIIIITIKVNQQLVESLAETAKEASYMDILLEQAWWIPFTTSFASIIMYSILLITTFIFLIIYMKRMITISFLIAIAPLICVTYSIDKIDNNRSEILNTWLKEFMYNVLIQPFHCIIYLVFIKTAVELLSGGNWIAGNLDFGAMILSVILTFGIFLGQKIIKEIFGFSESSSLTEKVAVLAMARNTVSTVKNIRAIKGSKNEKNAQDKVKQLPNYMPDAQKTDLNVMVRMREDFQQKTDESKKEKRNQSNNAKKPIQNTNSSNKMKANKTKKRRILKNAPRPIRRVGRLYRDVLATGSGYNFTRKVINNHKAKRAYKMTDEDYFVAASESYRQAVDANMTNEQLALEWDRIYKETDINNLKGPAVNYKLLIESMKRNYDKKGIDAYETMSQSILFGTTNNKMWRR